MKYNNKIIIFVLSIVIFFCFFVVGANDSITTKAENFILEGSNATAVSGSFINISDFTNTTTGSAIRVPVEDINAIFKPDKPLSSEKLNNIILNGKHIHSSDCYPGNLHEHNEFNCSYDKIVVASLSDGIYASSNATSWQKASNLIAREMTCGNNIFLGRTGESNLVRSEDGVNWVGYKIEIPGPSSTTFRSLNFHNGWFYVTTQTYNAGPLNGFLKSEDGVNWLPAYPWSYTEVIEDIGFSSGYAYYTIGSGDNYYRSHEITSNGSFYDYYADFNTEILDIYTSGQFALLNFRGSGNNIYRFKVNGNHTHLEITGKYSLLESVHTDIIGIDTDSGSPAVHLYENNRMNKIADLSAWENLTKSTLINFNGSYLLSNTTSSNNYIYKSLDRGYTWTSVNMPSTVYDLDANATNGSGISNQGPCAKDGKYYDSAGNEVSPICDQVAVSISAVQPNQTIKQKDPINQWANVTYLDGSKSQVLCTTDFNSTEVGIRTAVLKYSGLINNARNNGTLTCNITVDVKPRLKSISINVSSTVVYNGSEPTYIITAKYDGQDDQSIDISKCVKTGWSAGYGVKTVKFSYTEDGVTVNNSVVIVVRPNVTKLDISRFPSDANVYYGDSITFTAIATYEDGSTAPVSFYTNKPYDSSKLGLQSIACSYSEGGKIVTGTNTVTVLNYPVSLIVDIEKTSIYQSQKVNITKAEVTLANGAKENIIPTISEYDNMAVGDKNIIFSYELNNRSTSVDRIISIEADLYDMSINSSDFTIYKGQDLDIKVTAHLNINGDMLLKDSDFSIVGLDKNKYDREGKSYEVTYTNKGITISKSIFIKILPNIEKLNITTAPQTTEGEHIQFDLEVVYEDGEKLLLSEKDLSNENLNISNYDLNEVGYQDIIFKYSEGSKELSKEIKIRVRAIINVSIPINMMFDIEPNKDGNKQSYSIRIENNSKEPVIVAVQSFQNQSNYFKDVLPTTHENWSNLGLSNSKDIAIGLENEKDWLKNNLTNPVYVTSFKNTKDFGLIDKESSSTTNLIIEHGSSFNSKNRVILDIIWEIRLGD